MRDYDRERTYTRKIVMIGEHQFAVVTKNRWGKQTRVFFAVPPDGEPTGRLWARLEDVLDSR
jgi:hypothetical protein